MKYNVKGKTVVDVYLEVEAESEEEAIETAYDQLNELTFFTSDGAYGKMVGVREEEATLDLDDGIEWTSARPIEDLGE